MVLDNRKQKPDIMLGFLILLCGYSHYLNSNVNIKTLPNKHKIPRSYIKILPKWV